MSTATLERPTDTAAIAMPAIGQAWPGQGGVRVGIMRGINGGPDYHLIAAAPDALAKDIAWGPAGDAPAIDTHDGLSNTRLLAQCITNFPAARYAHNFQADGHSDFYLPSRRDASLLAANVPELFTGHRIWTSTQDDEYNAWLQDSRSTQGWGGKSNKYAVLPVRRFSVIN